jgi:phosphoglycerate dehydrogenase-like enzyme
MSREIKVLITLNLDSSSISRIQDVSDQLALTLHQADDPGDIPESTWGEAEVLFTHKVLPEREQAPRLKWIQFYRAGNDRYLGAAILQKPDLVATSLSGANTPQVAEHVLEMILALGHRLPEATRLKELATWPEERGEGFEAQELNQSTVGIIGYGSIGREVARLCSVFGARLLACKFNAKNPTDQGYILEGTGDEHGDFVHRLYPVQALGSMLKECDFVLLSVPLTKETHHLVGTKELSAMKKSAYLVDISRGGVINHAQLIAALEDGQIAGAALDVFPEEPLPADSPLWKLPNVILTPHIAGMSASYDTRAVDLFIENLSRYLDGKALLNLIDLERGY